MSKCVCGHERATHTSANDGACDVLYASGGECSCLGFAELVPHPTPSGDGELRDKAIELCARYGVAVTRMPDAIMQLIAQECATRERAAEQRGAAHAINSLSFKIAMDGRKTVKQAWLDSEGEEWAVDIVKFAQDNKMPVRGYNQWAAEVNAKAQLTQAQEPHP